MCVCVCVLLIWAEVEKEVLFWPAPGTGRGRFREVWGPILIEGNFQFVIRTMVVIRQEKPPLLEHDKWPTRRSEHNKLTYIRTGRPVE